MDVILIGLLILLVIAAIVGGFAFWIWALVDAIRVPEDGLYQSGTKLVWVLVIVLTGWIGAIIYLAVGRPSGGASAAIEQAAMRRSSADGGAALPPPPP
jgi:hypothetical protein